VMLLIIKKLDYLLICADGIVLADGGGGDDDDDEDDAGDGSNDDKRVSQLIDL